MKRGDRGYLFVAVVVVAALGLLGAESGAGDLPEVKRRGTLRVVVSATTDTVFFSLDEKGEPGFLQEVLRGFCDLHQLKMETRVSTTAQRVGELTAGRGDLIPMTSNDEDSTQLTFSSEVFPKLYVAVTRKPGPVVRSAEDLKKEKVAVQMGRNREDSLTSLGVPYKTLSPETDELALLRTGAFTATVVSLEAALAARTADPGVQIGMFVGPPVSRVFAVRKQDTALLQALNAYVENTRRSGSWQRLVVKYFGPNAVDILKSARTASQ